MVFVQDTPESSATSYLGQINDLLISLWRDYPRLVLGMSLKLYYLSQTAFWVQQIFVINVEERRKDHWQMFTHHIVTIFLLAFSYGYRQMRAGNAILVLMDVVDLIFPVCLPEFQRIEVLLTWIIACQNLEVHETTDCLRYRLRHIRSPLARRTTHLLRGNLLEYLCTRRDGNDAVRDFLYAHW